MTQDLRTTLRDLKERAQKVVPNLHIPEKKQKILELEDASSQPAFWNDRKKAETVLKEITFLKKVVEYWEKVESDIDLDLALLDDLEKNDDPAALKDLKKDIKDLEEGFQKQELAALLSEKYDAENTILAIHAGTGGVDAQDFAEMLLRMYLRFFESMEFDAAIVNESRGEEAGIKSAVIEVRGPFAFGYLKSENGVHRLVRQSPFNANALRQTSFALVEVFPLLENVKEVDIDPKDLRIDTYRASGAGGQHVNKTDSAVRITHIPTKLVVEVQSERSQAQNKERAMKILQSRLHLFFEEQKQKEKQNIRGEYNEAAWGNQIRSYVLHPYKLVKDHRTDFEVHDAEKVLNGEILPFIEAYLENRASEKNKAV